MKAALETLPESSVLTTIQHQINHRINTPLTSSIGRLFDAAAALAGIRQTINYEAQAAIEFEAIADPNEIGFYPFDITEETAFDGDQASSCIKTYIIDPSPLLKELVDDIKVHTPKPIISSRFHNGVAEMVKNVASTLRQDTGISQIALSGGVWQNTKLLTKTVVLLQSCNFTVLLHHQVPPNDGGISLGQAVIGHFWLTDIE